MVSPRTTIYPLLATCISPTRPLIYKILAILHQHLITYTTQHINILFLTQIHNTSSTLPGVSTCQIRVSPHYGGPLIALSSIDIIATLTSLFFASTLRSLPHHYYTYATVMNEILPLKCFYKPNATSVKLVLLWRHCHRDGLLLSDGHSHNRHCCRADTIVAYILLS